MSREGVATAVLSLPLRYMHTPIEVHQPRGTWRTWPRLLAAFVEGIGRGGGVPMKELLKTLCALNGVSGDEDQVREFLAERARPWARSMQVDPLGNLIVWKKGARAAGDRLMLCAHMDEVGLDRHPRSPKRAF